MKNGGKLLHPTRLLRNSCGYHLMLDQYWAMEFIKFIEERRNWSIEKKE
jgi:hypothetical protein